MFLSTFGATTDNRKVAHLISLLTGPVLTWVTAEKHLEKAKIKEVNNYQRYYHLLLRPGLSVPALVDSGSAGNFLD